MRSFYFPHDRSATWYTGEVVNPVTGEVTKPPSRTKQSFKDECDINNIVKHFKATGMVSHINQQAARGTYADLPDPLDFQDAIHMVEAAQASFDTLPSKVRARFENDPGRFLEFMANPANLEEARELGLLKPQAPAEDPAPAPVPVPSPAPGGTGG